MDKRESNGAAKKVIFEKVKVLLMMIMFNKEIIIGTTS